MWCIYEYKDCKLHFHYIVLTLLVEFGLRLCFVIKYSATSLPPARCKGVLPCYSKITQYNDIHVVINTTLSNLSDTFKFTGKKRQAIVT